MVAWLYCSKGGHGRPAVFPMDKILRCELENDVTVDYQKNIELIYTHGSLVRMDAKKVWRKIEGIKGT